MSDQDDIPEGMQRPGRAIQQTAPGVFGARELPKSHVAASLSTGDVVGGRFEVLRYLGASGGGISYLCVDQSHENEVVIKVLAMAPPSKTKFDEMYDQVRIASGISHRNLTKIIGMGRTPSGEAFVAMEYVKGATLSSLIAQRRQESGALSLRDAFTVIAHIANGLDPVHARMAHGVLTPYNVYIEKRGVVRVGNLAFGKLAAEMLLERNEGPYVDSIYVAPEIADAPELLNSAADIYSLGMLTADMLCANGLSNDRDEARFKIAQELSGYPPELMKLIMRAIGEDLTGRPKDVATFRDSLKKIVESTGIQLSGPPPPGGLPVESAVHEADAEEDIFAIPELSGLAEPTDTSNERYLVQREGLDYGPFSAEMILEQLHRDEIDEFSPVLDRVSQDRMPLGECPRFKRDVQEYLPKRQERRRIEAELRAKRQQQMKKGGLGLLYSGIAGGVIVLGIMMTLYFLQPAPEPIPLDRAFASLDYKFQPPPKDFQAVAVDSSLLNSMFNPKASEEEIAKVLATKRKKSPRRASSNSKKRNGEQGGETEVQEIDMSANGSDHILTDEDVNDVIMSNFGGLRSCILTELKSDSRFRGVTVQFFVRPSGTTGGVKIKEEKYRDRQVADCLTSRFRSMKFPDHGGLNRGVTFPLLVQ